MAKKKKNKTKIFKSTYSEIENDEYLKYYIKNIKSVKTTSIKIENLSQIVKNCDVVDAFGFTEDDIVNMSLSISIDLVEKIKEDFKECVDNILIKVGEAIGSYVSIIGNNIVIQTISLETGKVYDTLVHSCDEPALDYHTAGYALEPFYKKDRIEEIEAYKENLRAAYIVTMKCLLNLYESGSTEIYKAIVGIKSTIILKHFGFKRKYLKDIEEEFKTSIIEDRFLKAKEVILNTVRDEKNKDAGSETSVGKFNSDILLPPSIFEVDSIKVDADVLFEGASIIRTHDLLQRFLKLPNYFNELYFSVFNKELSATNNILEYYIERNEEELFIVSINTLEQDPAKKSVVQCMGIKVLENGFININVAPNYSVFNPRNYEMCKKQVDEEGDILQSEIQTIFSLLLFTYEKLEQIRIAKRKKASAINNAHSVKTKAISKEVALTTTEIESPSRVDTIQKIYDLSKLDSLSINFKSRGFREKLERGSVRKHAVTGFWRHYKSGKTIWIDPFSRGGGEKVKKEIVLK